MNGPIARRLGASAALVVTMTMTTGGAGAAPVTTSAPTNCPAVYPVSQVHEGMHGTGFTTTHGRTPTPFRVVVLGVQKNAIAPGIDIIIIRTHSPMISSIGGIWEGMSGSPIYAPDGRLIGALAYGMSLGATHTAGVTPAAAMYRLRDLHIPGTAGHVALTLGLQRAVTADGSVSATTAAGGMSPLTTPVVVSGLGPVGMRELAKSFDASNRLPVRLLAGGAANSRPADPARVRPGAPIAAALSYGGFTFAAVGTVTAVCNGQALAFGHPMQEYGATTQSAHLARVLYVQRDPLGVSYVQASIGGRVGLVDQDRLPGIRIDLGRYPKPTSQVVAKVHANTGLSRTVRTHVPLVEWVPQAAANTIYMGLFATLEKESSGEAVVHWSATGHRRDGSRWSYTRSDRAATQWGLPFEATDPVYQALVAIGENPFEDVTIEHVTATVNAFDKYRSATVSRLSVKDGGHYVVVDASTVVAVHPRDTLSLRVQVLPFRHRGPARTFDLSVKVPAHVGVGVTTLQLTGGGNMSAPDLSLATSFDDLLARLATQPRHDRVYAQVDVPDPFGNFVTRTVGKIALDRVVTGSIQLQLDVS